MMLPSIGRKSNHPRAAYPPAKPIMNRPSVSNVHTIFLKRGDSESYKATRIDRQKQAETQTLCYHVPCKNGGSHRMR